jgi:uncharacterized membrane protein (UPF0127 family)
MIKLRVLLVCAALAAVATGTVSFLTASMQPATPTSLVSITLKSPQGKTETLKVETALTQAQQELGLMNRRTVTRGMLFVFDNAQQVSFWMKNTLVPLDIVFFTSSGRFSSSARMVPCVGDPCTLYASTGSVKYALEMPAGFLSKEGVGSGWQLIAPRFGTPHNSK